MSECFNVDGVPKKRFDTRADARRRIAEIPELEGCKPYRCSVCQFFHIGHYPSDPVARCGLRARHHRTEDAA